MQKALQVFITVLCAMFINNRVLQSNKPCEDNCVSCVESKCSECKEEFYLDDLSGSCQTCPQYPTCKRCDAGRTCLSCVEGYQMDTNSGKCHKEENCPAFPNCLKCKDVCLKCNEGFYISEGYCFPCVPNCKSCDSNSCLECFPPFKLNNNLCLPECSPPIENCSNCTLDNKCYTCQDGYTLNGTTCQKCSDPNCLRCNKNSCTLCKVGFSLFFSTNGTICRSYSNCIKYNDNSTCIQCYDGFYLINGKCEICRVGEYSFNNECFQCKDKFKNSLQCTATSILKCAENSSNIVTNECNCNSLYFSFFDKCIHSMLFIAIILIFILLAFCLVFYINRKCRNLYPAYFINTPPINQETYENDDDTPEEIIELKLLTGDEVHGNTCVFKDENIPYWKLNCGGYICNECSLIVISKLCNKEHISCTKCKSEIKYFDYVERKINQEPETNSSNMSIQNIILKYDAEPTNKCQICFYFEADKKIECDSPIPHSVCAYCFKRIFYIGKKGSCPFCRSLIKEEIKM